MIAFLSSQIEAGARAVASVLVSILPFLPDSLVTNPEKLMIVVGFAGQGLFAMRFIIQKLAEGRHSVAALAARGRALGVELPITDGVDGLVNHGEDLRKVVASLLARPAGAE